MIIYKKLCIIILNDFRRCILRSKLNAITLSSVLLLACFALIFSLYTIPQKQPELKAAGETITFSTSDGDTGYILYGTTKFANQEFCSKVIVMVKQLSDGAVVASTVATISSSNTTFTLSMPSNSSGNQYQLVTITPTYGSMTFDTDVVEYSGIFTYQTGMEIDYSYAVDFDIWFTGVKVL